MTRAVYTLEIPSEALAVSIKYSPVAAIISAVIYAVAVSVSNTLPSLILASIMPVTFLVMKRFPLSHLVSINVFNLAWLTNEQIEMFTSDFKDVALFLRAQRTKTQYRGSKRKTRHIKDLLAVLTALSGSNMYAEYANTIQEEEQSKDKGGYTMDWVTAELLNTGRSEGLAEGLAEGLVKGRDEMMKMMSMLFRSLRESGKEEELDRALTDQEYLRKLMDDFQQKEQTQSI